MPARIACPRLQLQTLEDRTAPAFLQLDSASTGGSVDISTFNPDGTLANRWQHNLGSSGGGDSRGSFDYYGAVLGSFLNGGWQTEAYGSVSGGDANITRSGSLSASSSVQVQIAPEDGEAEGTPVTVVAANLGAFPLPAIANGTGQVFRNGELVLEFTGSPQFEDRRDFQAKVGDTLRISSQVFILASTVPDGVAVPARSQLHLSLTPVAPGEVTVTAQHDADTAPDVFGPYLTTVKLKNKFTINVAANDTTTRQFRFTIAGSPIKPEIVKRKPGGTPVTIEMGLLQPGSYGLTVEALDSKKVKLAEFEGTISVNGQLGLDLQVSAEGDSHGAHPVETARIIAGVKVDPKLVYHPTVSGNVPSYYSNKLGLSFYDTATSKLKYHHPIASITGGQGTMPGPINANLYRDVLPDTGDHDYAIFLTPAQQHRLGKGYHKFSGAESLRVVLIPDWLKKNKLGASEFRADEDTAGIYGQGGAAYAFSLDSGKRIDIPLPKTSDGPFGILEGLKSKVMLDADFTVYAGLFEDQPATVRADRVELSAVLLGEPLFDTDLDPDTLPVTLESPLDPLELDEPEQITIGTAGAINLLPLFGGTLDFDQDFGPWDIELSDFHTFWLPGLDATVRLSGEFSASIRQLDLSGSLTFDFANGRILPDVVGGTFKLDFDAFASATLNAGASVSVKVFDHKVIDLASINATGGITFLFSGSVAGTFLGESGFQLDEDPQDTFLNLDVAYNFDYNVNFLTKSPDDDPLPAVMDNAADSALESVWDF